ncbi:MAG TPA: hypothetical protein VHJ20_22645 [Polyangia bacterium]|nr:hypothetical protein [Polyangia bacterium]
MSPAAKGLAFLTVAALALGCRVPLLMERPARSDRPCAESDACAEVLGFGSFQDAVGVWLWAPPDTRLLNATFSIDDEPPCAGHSPVEWVKVDRVVYEKSPAPVGGAHGLLLGFPIDAWFAHSGYWRATFVDLSLDVGGVSRCVRERLTDAAGHVAVGP